MCPRRLLALVASLAFLGLSAPARAGDDFDLTVSKGLVTVTAKGEWHISSDYPWKLVVGDVKVDVSKFTLTEKTASVSGAPSGHGTLRGAVCAGTRCKSFKEDVSIP